MRYYTCIHPGSHGQLVRETWSESQILAAHFDEWLSKCIKAGVDKAHMTTHRCVEDWVTVTWAWETDADGELISHD